MPSSNQILAKPLDVAHVLLLDRTRKSEREPRWALVDHTPKGLSNAPPRPHIAAGNALQAKAPYPSLNWPCPALLLKSGSVPIHFGRSGLGAGIPSPSCEPCQTLRLGPSTSNVLRYCLILLQVLEPCGVVSSFWRAICGASRVVAKSPCRLPHLTQGQGCGMLFHVTAPKYPWSSHTRWESLTRIFRHEVFVFPNFHALRLLALVVQWWSLPLMVSMQVACWKWMRLSLNKRAAPQEVYLSRFGSATESSRLNSI